MLFLPEQGAFALGIAVGVLGLVMVFSLIIAWAYDEQTLLVIAAYLAFMVGAPFLLAGAGISTRVASHLLLIAGPALASGLLFWLLKNREPAGLAKGLMVAVGVASLALAGMSLATGAETATPASVAASVGWLGLLLGFSCYLLEKSWHTAGPWKWWVLVGLWAGLAVSTLLLTGVIAVSESQGPLGLMLLLQVPPIYLALVWRSRLLNESRLRVEAADVIDPLTGLATTRVLVERLMRVMSRAHQSQTNSALFLIEVKNWQGLLNELGPEFGEKLLLEAALRLRRAIGDNDLAARAAGGRFAVVAQGLSSDEDVRALATRLVVTGLRIDSPLLPGVEFQFRVLVSQLKLSRPMALPDTEGWLQELATQFSQWPHSHRSRSILVVAGREVTMPGGLKVDSAY